MSIETLTSAILSKMSNDSIKQGDKINPVDKTIFTVVIVGTYQAIGACVWFGTDTVIDD